jgi:hypothetical protein
VTLNGHSHSTQELAGRRITFEVPTNVHHVVDCRREKIWHTGFFLATYWSINWRIGVEGY